MIARRFALSAFLCLGLFYSATLPAQNISWIQLPINTSLSPDTVLEAAPFCNSWIITNLPCYGHVLITETFPGNVTDFNNAGFQNVPNASGSFVNVEPGYGPYSWGPCADLNFYNTLTSGTNNLNYTLNFYFLDGPPPYFNLFLDAGGLGQYTTATVSQPVVFRGEYDLPGAAHTCITNAAYDPRSGATGVTNAGTVGTVLGSYYGTDRYGDPVNTSWPLFQPTGQLLTTNLPQGNYAFCSGYPGPATVPYLSLNVSQMPGDGIGFSLGYVCLTNVDTNDCLIVYNPNDIVVSTCSNCVPVTYQVNVIDNCCSNIVSVVSSPASGYCFPVGTTVVTTTAKDDMGNTASGTFTVTVLTGTNCPTNCLQIACPGNIVTNCTTDAGTEICFTVPTATDGCSSNCQPVTVTATWPGASQSYSGPVVCANFPIGITPVTFTATDACGHTNTCTMTITVHSQGVGLWQGDWVFADGTTNPPEGTSQGNSIAVDSFGNSFVVGQFTGTVTFQGQLPMYSYVNGGSPITLHSQAANLSDGFVAKYDTTGHLLWAESLRGYNAFAKRVAVDSQGNCFVTGRFQNYIFQSLYQNIGNPLCPSPALFAVGVQDMFLAKFDPNGAPLWALNAGDARSVGNAAGLGVAVDNNDNCYVAGNFKTQAWFGNSVNPCGGPGSPQILGSSSGGDAFLAKYDGNGILLWATNSTCLGADASANATGVAVDSNGHAWICGHINRDNGSGVRFGVTPALLSPTNGYINAIVVKYDSNGNAIWARQLDGDTGIQDALGIGVDSSGNSYFTAYYNGTAKLGTNIVTDPNPVGSPPTYGFTANQLYDYLVGSLDPNGNARWLTNGGLINDNESRALAVTPTGNVFVTGPIAATNEFESGGLNIMLNEYNSSGTLVWQATGISAVSNPQENNGLGVAVDAAGCVYLTGDFNDPGVYGSPADAGLVFPYFASPMPLSAPGGSASTFVLKYCAQCASTSPCCGPNLGPETIQWLQLPISTNANSVQTVLSGTNPCGTWLITNMQCYGRVLITETFPTNATDFSNPGFQNVPNAAGRFVNEEPGYGPYNWGTFPSLGFVNTVTSTNLNYTVNFYFLDGPPNPCTLYLDAAGLGQHTTATISQPVIFRGEYDLFAGAGSAHTSLTNAAYDPGTGAAGSTNAGGVGTVIGSYYNTDHFGDDVNTGLGLFQPAGQLLTTNLPQGALTNCPGYPASAVVAYLSLNVSQQPGDGIGFNVGYVCCTNQPSTNCCANCVAPYPESYTVTVYPGQNYLADDLCQGTNNTIADLLPNVPPRSTIEIWNEVTQSFTLATRGPSGWSNPNLMLSPGEGFILVNPTQTNFTLTISGCQPTCPLPCLPESGFALVGAPGTNTATWSDLSSCPPICGTEVITLNPQTQQFSTNTYINGTWVPSAPFLRVGQSAFVGLSANFGFTVFCPTNKSVPCGSQWTFDPPSAFSCCTNNFVGSGFLTNILVTSLGASTSGVCPQLITMSWFIEDGCGNSNSCSQTVTVISTNPPILSNCGTNYTVPCSSTTWTFASPTATDPCSGTNLPIIAITVTNSLCPLTLTRIWTVTNACGLSNSCSQTVTLLDQPQIVSCATNLVLCISSNGCATLGDYTSQVQAGDSCSSFGISQSPSAGTVICTNTELTFTVSNACGNTAMCTATVLLEACASNCCGPNLGPQTIEWLQFPLATNSPVAVLLNTNACGAWLVTNLPCYGKVLITETFPGNVTDFNNAALQNVPSTGGTFVNAEPGYGPYDWGACPGLNFLNNITTTNLNYTLNFFFLSGPPNPCTLFLGVAGLADETTVVASQPVVFRGEYDLTNSPASAHTSITNSPYNAGNCFCAGVTNAGTVGIEIGSYYNKDLFGDSVNTGWALFQPTSQLLMTNVPGAFTNCPGYPAISTNVPCLTLNISQQPGDGIGFNVGYVCCTNCAPSIITSTTYSHHITTITFQSQAGFSYLVEYADCLTCPWTPLQTVTASGASTTVQDTFPNNRQRFYRVLCLGPATTP